MKRLFKLYSINTNEDYYNLIRDSYENGQRKQAKEQFFAMPKINRVDFLKDLIYYKEAAREESIFFFNALHNL